MHNKNLGSMAAAVLVVLLGGCATMEYVPINRSRPQELQYQLKAGETVHVRLQNGEHHQFRIVALEPDAIIGDGQRVAYRDIDMLEVKTVDYEGPTKTALAIGALALVYIAGAVIEAELDEDEGITCDSNGMGGCIPRQGR